jgi:DNA-binding LacI/PurR family transcriptional regulator
VTQSTEEVAAAAVELLFERLRNEAAPPRLVELPVSLAVRGSSGRPAAA